MPDPINRIQADGLAPLPKCEEPRFDEESRTPLTDGDRDRLLDMIDNPPEPNESLEEAAKRLRGTSDRTG